MQADILDSETKFSCLVDAAENGEEVFLMRNGVAVAQLVPVRRHKFKFGFLKDEISPVSDKLLFAMTEDEAHQFIDGAW